MEAVKQLSLVLVDSLDLDVKDGGRVDLDFVVFLNVLCQLHLVLLQTDQQKNFTIGDSKPKKRKVLRLEHGKANRNEALEKFVHYGIIIVHGGIDVLRFHGFPFPTKLHPDQHLTSK